MTFKWHHSWPQGHGQGHYEFASPNPTTSAFNTFSSMRNYGSLDALIDFDFKHDHDHDDDLDSRTYLNVKFSALSIYEVKSGGSHLKTSIWPSNDLDHWPQSHDGGPWPWRRPWLKDIPEHKIFCSFHLWGQKWGFPFENIDLTFKWPWSLTSKSWRRSPLDVPHETLQLLS